MTHNFSNIRLPEKLQKLASDLESLDIITKNYSYSECSNCKLQVFKSFNISSEKLIHDYFIKHVRFADSTQINIEDYSCEAIIIKNIIE